MKKKQKIIVFAVLPIALVAGLIYWLSWSGNTDHIESVADQFQADSSWTLVDHYAVPPKTDCIAQVCPRLEKTWTTAEPITQEKLTDVLRLSGWDNVKVDQGCIELRTNNPKPYSCPFYGQVNKYSVRIFANDSNSALNLPTISVSLE